MILRRVQPKDTTPIYNLLKQYFEESRYRDREFDRGKAYLLAGRSLLDNTSFGLVIEENDEVVGMFLGTLSEYIFNDDLFAQDEIYYIKPEYRGKAPTRSVLATFSDWAQEQGAKEIRLSVTSGISTDRTTLLYNKLGYLDMGTYVGKEI